MKLPLTALCVLGVLTSGVFGMYSIVSIGTDGLNSLSSSLKSIQTVMAAYHKNLNAARSKIMSSIDKLVVQVNSTYKSMNDSYGAVQSNMANIMSRLDMLSKQFQYGEQHYNSIIYNDLSHSNERLMQSMSRIIYNHYAQGISYYFQHNAEECALEFAGLATSLPNQLTKYGTCLQTSVDIVPTVVAPVQDIFDLVRKDFISLNKQLKICAVNSVNCINEYFMNVDMELNNIFMEISMAGSLITNQLENSKERNNLCADLVSYNCEGLNERLMIDFKNCIYPPV